MDIRQATDHKSSRGGCIGSIHHSLQLLYLSTKSNINIA